MRLHFFAYAFPPTGLFSVLPTLAYAFAFHPTCDIFVRYLMPDNRMIPLCKLYKNTSKTSGRRYFVGNLSFTSKLLIFQNEDAKEGEPGWTVFIAEREQKPKPYPEAGNHGGIEGGDYPARRRAF